MAQSAFRCSVLDFSAAARGSLLAFGRALGLVFEGVEGLAADGVVVTGAALAGGDCFCASFTMDVVRRGRRYAVGRCSGMNMRVRGCRRLHLGH